MKNALRYLVMVAIIFVVLFSAFMAFVVILPQRISSARSRLYHEARRREDVERNLHLMTILPEYFAGSYYHSRWRGNPGQLVILVAGGGDFDVDWPSAARIRRVEFSYAQLQETKTDVIAAKEARTGCFYADSVGRPGISIPCNKIVMTTLSQSQTEHENIVSGFKQYVYDSEMMEFRLMLELPLNYGQGSYIYTALSFLLISAIIAFFVHFVVEERKQSKKQIIHNRA